MPRLDARVDLARDGRLFITPGPNAKLRSLERALRATGIPLQLDPVAGGALIDVSEFEICRTSLSDWSLETTTRAQVAADHVRRRRAWHPAALAACRAATSSPEVGRSWLKGYERIDLLDDHQVTAVALASHPDVRGLCIFD
jgi:hypothetical protein